MTWESKNRAVLVNTNAYTAIITDYGQMIQLDDVVAKSVFSLDPEEYCWMDWSDQDITDDYDSYDEAIENFEIIAEWAGEAVTIHDLDRWQERKTFFLGEDDDEWVTGTEASQRWDLSDSTIRRAILDGRFKEGEFRKSGGTWLVTISGMKRLYGEPKKKLDIDTIEAILEVQNLGIDYESFDTGDELADYLDGRKFPEFDEPMEVSEEQREGLREIYEDR